MKKLVFSLILIVLAIVPKENF